MRLHFARIKGAAGLAATTAAVLGVLRYPEATIMPACISCFFATLAAFILAPVHIELARREPDER